MRNPFRREPKVASPTGLGAYLDMQAQLRKLEVVREQHRQATKVLDDLRVVQMNDGSWRPVIPGQWYFLHIGGKAYRAKAEWMNNEHKDIMFALEEPAMGVALGEWHFDDITPYAA